MAQRMLISVFIAASFGSQAAAGDEGAFSLTRVIPADVQFYAVERASPQRARLEEPFLQAFRELIGSGIGEDFFDLATHELSSEKRDEARAVAGRLIQLFKTPSWSELVGKETAIAIRLSIPVPEIAALFLVPADSAGARQEEFRKLFAGLAEFAPQNLEVIDSDRRSAKVSRLELKGSPFALWTASREGVVAVCTSTTILDRIFDLMDTKDGAGSLALDPRFGAGMKEMAEGGQDGLGYFDLPGYLSFLRGFVDMAGGAVQNEPDAAGAISLVRVVLDELARLGPLTWGQKIQGQSVITGGSMALVQKDGPGFLEKLVADQKPIRDFTRVVPRDAVAFYLSSGLDPTRIYDAVVDQIKKRIPKGEKALGAWERVQDKIGFHLREDLLTSIDGGLGWIALPGVSAGGHQEVLVFLRLRGKEKPRRLFEDGISKAKEFLAGRGQALELADVPGLNDFQELRIAALPWFHPVIGWPGDTMVLASSAGAANRVAATFRGEAPSFRDSPAFAAMQVPGESVNEVYYRDLKGSLECLASLMGTVGFGASILPREKDTVPLIKLGAMLTKLSAFLRKVDLMVDQGGWSRYDAEKHVMTYRQVTQLKGDAK